MALAPIAATAITAQIRLGMVRMILSSMRMLKTSHVGPIVWAAPRAMIREMIIAKNVARIAISTVSIRAEPVDFSTDRSGGKKSERKRPKFFRMSRSRSLPSIWLPLKMTANTNMSSVVLRRLSRRYQGNSASGGTFSCSGVGVGLILEPPHLTA